MTAGGVSYHVASSTPIATANTVNTNTNIGGAAATAITPTSRRRKFASPMPRANNIGMPGSRRYQRHLNKSYLMDQEGELELEDFLIYQHMHNPIFTTKSPLWEKLINTTEERQADLLRAIAPETEPIHHNTSAWDRMDKRLKRLLVSAAHSTSLLSIDTEVRNFIHSQENTLNLFPEDGFGRLLCHGVSQYYGLKPATVNSSPSSRVVVVQQNKSIISPARDLIPFLQSQIQCQSTLNTRV